MIVKSPFGNERCLPQSYIDAWRRSVLKGGVTMMAFMKVDKVTKRTVRYREMDKDGKQVDEVDSIFPTVYIRKSAFKGSWPDKIKLEVTSGTPHHSTS